MTMARTRTPAPGTRDVRRAWLALALDPAALVGAYVVSETLASTLGDRAFGSPGSPWWVLLGAGLPALVVFAVPGVMAARWALRAVRQGNAGGRRPLELAVALLGTFVVLNTLSMVTVLVGGGG